MKIGVKFLIGGTLLCIVFYIGIFVGRISAQDTVYMPYVHRDLGVVSLEPLDLNDATVDTLTMIPGVGDSLATAIVEYKQKYGAYIQVEELLDVPGMTEDNYNAIIPYVKVVN